MDVVTAGGDAGGDLCGGPLQVWRAGEGGAFVDDGLDCLELWQIELLAALGDDCLFYFLGAALACADDEG